ncbi:hypothetical protein [Streptomyces sp. NPDC048639]|uniref:hypothetical protein n=1 Tax=Streptomyces sp. NPDC048639 TaxID=3365581 RepID=UPI00371E144A
MVTMMMDAAEDGEDPLSDHGRRSLMWSGLCQRFASRPFAGLLTVLILLSLGVFEWSTYRMVKTALHVDAHDTGGSVSGDLWFWLLPASSALLLLAGITTLTISMLRLPPLPRRPAGTAPWGWTAWPALGASLAMPLVGSVLAVVSLVAGVRLYHRTRQGRYRVLAALSAASIALTALFLLPQASILLLENQVG